MALICAECGSDQLQRRYSGTPREEIICRMCRAVDRTEGTDDEKQEEKDK
jgi:hypothetical protein